jgi:predicted Zn-dependent peptidase
MRRAGHLISAEIYGFPEDVLKRLAASFEAVTADDILRVASEHLYPERCCLAAAGPTSTEELMPLLGAGIGG